MEIFLSKSCESLTGALNTNYGYVIRHRRKHFFAMRSPKGYVPSDGHWRFIVTCAQLAQSKLYITDISLTKKEFLAAIHECGFVAVDSAVPKTLNADTVLTLKRRWNL